MLCINYWDGASTSYKVTKKVVHYMYPDTKLVLITFFILLQRSKRSSSLKMAVDKAYEEGILVVAAAGNDGSKNGKDDSFDYPAIYDSVIAVGATTESDKRAEFSSTGDTVEVAAPESNILSAYVKNSYATMSGTSRASPYVAGQLALLIQENPELSHTEIRSLLGTTVKDLGVKGKDIFFGHSLIQEILVML